MRFPFVTGLIVLLIAASLSIWNSAHGTEPNETFDSATVLSSGVTTVADELSTSVASFPDTLLGVRDLFGQVYFVDDDSSPLGDGRASGVEFVPTNSGSIDFSVTGFGDDSFVGSHGESGQYKVFVKVYDFFGDPVDSFSEVRTLAPGVVHDFSYSNFEWTNGDYDAYIDNTIGAVPAADVDFFQFTGLTPGAQFAARTADPAASGIDTLLGWFDAGGSLLESDDDGAGGPLSLIDGIVPAGGSLTFAVTGFTDAGFTGAHSVTGSYELRLQIQPAGLPGDYNEDEVVDAADYTLWRDQLGSATSLPNDDTSGVGPDDYTRWRTHFGQTLGAASLTTAVVPEPATLAWIIFLAPAWNRLRRTARQAVTSAAGAP